MTWNRADCEVPPALCLRPGKVTVRVVERRHAGMSAWNGAGTWEEKDMSAWMRDRVKEGLLALEGPESLKIDKVLSCSGEARLLHVRGKFRVGFELAVKVNWSGKPICQPHYLGREAPR